MCKECLQNCKCSREEQNFLLYPTRKENSWGIDSSRVLRNCSRVPRNSNVWSCCQTPPLLCFPFPGKRIKEESVPRLDDPRGWVINCPAHLHLTHEKERQWPDTSEISPGVLAGWTFPQLAMSNSAKTSKAKGDPEPAYIPRGIPKTLNPRRTALGQHYLFPS